MISSLFDSRDLQAFWNLAGSCSDRPGPQNKRNLLSGPHDSSMARIRLSMSVASSVQRLAHMAMMLPQMAFSAAVNPLISLKTCTVSWYACEVEEVELPPAARMRKEVIMILYD